LTVEPVGHFAPVQVNENLTFDFADEPEPWGGRGFYFEDPSGHVLEVMTVPETGN